MGREATCQCDWAGATASVKALLESGEIILRGDLRKHIPLSDVKAAAVHGDRLCFTVAGEPIQLVLGNDQAVKWAAAIQAGPASLAKKLGIKPESKIRIIGSSDDHALNAAIAEATEVAAKNPDLIVASVETPADLDAALKTANTQVLNGVPIWIVYTKGKGHAIDEGAIRSTLRARGLMDTKVASVSARLTALRFNLRRG